MKKQIIEILKKEIEWCEKHPLVRITRKNDKDNDALLTKSFEYGFKDGLKQAIRLVRAIPKI